MDKTETTTLPTSKFGLWQAGDEREYQGKADRDHKEAISETQQECFAADLSRDRIEPVNEGVASGVSSRLQFHSGELMQIHNFGIGLCHRGGQMLAVKDRTTL